MSILMISNQPFFYRGLMNSQKTMYVPIDQWLEVGSYILQHII